MNTGKIVITGGEGFLGKYVVERLKKEGMSPVLLDKKKHDLFDPQSLEELLKGAGVIIHLAGANRDSDFNLIRVNTLGTAALLESISKYAKGAKLIFSSTAQVYTDGVYGLSKKFAEQLIENYSNRKLVRGIVLRISNIYGVGCRPFYNSVIATFIHLANEKKPIVINGDGSQRRDYVYVEDVVDAIIKSIDYNMENSIEHFDICSGKLVSLNEIVDKLRFISKKEIDVQYNKNYQGSEWEIKRDHNLASEKLGWNPKTTLDQGLRYTIQSPV